jgi:hypothetical protein
MGVDIVGKKEYLQDDKDDEQLNQNDSPQGTAYRHLAKAVSVKVESAV